jgi:glycerol-3-phosphate acyltransferase PlsY
MTTLGFKSEESASLDLIEAVDRIVRDAKAGSMTFADFRKMASTVLLSASSGPAIGMQELPRLLTKAFADFRPSISTEDMTHYLSVYSKFNGGGSLGPSIGADTQLTDGLKLMLK